MPLFVAKRTLPGITPEALMSAGLRAKTCCAEMTQEGESVHLGSQLFPAVHRADSLLFRRRFEASRRRSQPARPRPVRRNRRSDRDDAGDGLIWATTYLPIHTYCDGSSVTGRLQLRSEFQQFSKFFRGTKVADLRRQVRK